MVLFIVRHGQSVWNKENKFTGITDVDLSDYGKSEARKVGNLLKSIEFEAVFSSQLSRTIDTSVLIMEQNKFGLQHPVILKDLEEETMEV